MDRDPTDRDRLAMLQQPRVPSLAGFEFMAEDVASHDAALATLG